jgi:hypothetical protein
MIRRRGLAATVASVALAACVLVAPPAFGTSPAPGTPVQIAALVAASVKIKALNSAQIKALPNAGVQNADLAFHIPGLCELNNKCEYGDTKSRTTVVLLGDSHARMWLPALMPTATADHFKILVLGRDGCPLVSYKLRTFADCAGVMGPAIKAINKIKPAVVIVSNRTSWLENITSSQWQSAETDALLAIKASGAKVAMIGDDTAFNVDLIDCLAMHPSRVQECSTKSPDPAKPGHQPAESAAAASVGVVYINPLPWLCTSTKCSPIVGSFFAYWDNTHISYQYSRFLSAVLASALQTTLAGV